MKKVGLLTYIFIKFPFMYIKITKNFLSKFSFSVFPMICMFSNFFELNNKSIYIFSLHLVKDIIQSPGANI